MRAATSENAAEIFAGFEGRLMERCRYEEVVMRKVSNGTGLLIVVELGADWPGWALTGSSARRVLTQAEGETPATFADRVASSLGGSFGKGVKLMTVALACNERIDESADAARRKLAGLALGAMAKHRAGKLYLTAAPHSSGRLRHSLSSLAQGLHQEWSTAGLQASVELGEERGSGPTAAPFTFTARVA